jgi:hypothetical protein
LSSGELEVDECEEGDSVLVVHDEEADL